MFLINHAIFFYTLRCALNSTATRSVMTMQSVVVVCNHNNDNDNDNCFIKHKCI